MRLSWGNAKIKLMSGILLIPEHPKNKCLAHCFFDMEVYPFLLKGKKNKGWSYLCKKHYYQELKRFKGKLPACRV